MKNIYKFFLILVIISFQKSIYSKLRLINVPIANLKNKPFVKNKDYLKYPIFSKDIPEQNTQLLYNEAIYVLRKKRNLLNGKKWLYVQCLEQKKYQNDKFKPLEGWIKKEETIEVENLYTNNLIVNKNWSPIYSLKNKKLLEVCIGTKFTLLEKEKNKCRIILPNLKIGYIPTENVNFYVDYKASIFTKTISKFRKEIQKKIINNAKIFIDMPYSWGGRSAFNSKIKTQTSIDCSGFTNLVYNICGLEIPRNAQDQFNYSSKLYFTKLMNPGDLIFLAKPETPKKIYHVLLYIGKNKLQESVGNCEPYKNRIITFNDLFGVTKKEIVPGKTYNENVIYAGSFLSEEKKISEMREFFLRNCFKL